MKHKRLWFWCLVLPYVALSAICIQAYALDDQSAGLPVRHAVPAPVPSLSVTASSRFFAWASQVAVQLAERDFDRVHLPNVTASWSLPVIGQLQLHVTKISLDSLDLSTSASGLAPAGDDTLLLTASGLTAVVNCHFQYEHDSFPKISGGAHAEAHFQDGKLQQQLSVTNDGTGRPAIDAVNPAAVSFHSISIKTSDAKLAWLYNAILKLFQDNVRDLIDKEVSKQMTQKLPPAVNHLLAGIPTLVNVKGLTLNVSMAGNPVITPDQLVVHDWGRFQLEDLDCPYGAAADWLVHSARAAYPQPNNTFAPEYSSAAVLSASVEGHRQVLTMGQQPHSAGMVKQEQSQDEPMLAADIDPSIVNCLTWVLYKRGVLQRHLTSQEVPIALDTDSWASVIPQLPQLYPHQHMTLDAAIPEPLSTQFTAADGVVITGNATLTFQLVGNITAGFQAQPLFQLGLHSKLKADKVAVTPDTPDRPNSWRLHVHLQLVPDSISVQVLQSQVGEVQQAALQSSVRYLASTIAQNWIDKELLKEGFAIPDIPHINILQPSIHVRDGALSIAADVSYVP